VRVDDGGLHHTALYIPRVAKRRYPAGGVFHTHTHTHTHSLTHTSLDGGSFLFSLFLGHGFGLVGAVSFSFSLLTFWGYGVMRHDGMRNGVGMMG